MSNIKLYGNTWDTSGIFDSSQQKTQNLVNADVSALLEENAVAVPYTNDGFGYIIPATGAVYSSAASSHTNFIDVSKFSILKFSIRGTTAASIDSGSAFYDSNNAWVHGIRDMTRQAQVGYSSTLCSVLVPDEAVYFRTTLFNDTSTYGNMAIYGIYKSVYDINDVKDNSGLFKSYDTVGFEQGGVLSFNNANTAVDTSIRSQYVALNGNSNIDAHCDSEYSFSVYAIEKDPPYNYVGILMQNGTFAKRDNADAKYWPWYFKPTEYQAANYLFRFELVHGGAAITPEEGSHFHLRRKALAYHDFAYTDYQYQSTTSADRLALPILYLNGDTTRMSKDVKVDMTYVFNENIGSCTCKWQGSSSLKYPKKNYTITLDTALTLVSRWGAQKKYVLKSEYFDNTHTRNTVSAQLWGAIARDRETKKGAFGNAKILAAPNYGAMDGFHVMLVINGLYMGLYTLGIPKDAWMFGMTDEDENCCVLNAEVSGNQSVKFRETTTESAIENAQSFAIEYASEDMSITEITDSINAAITAVMNATGSGYRSSIEDYIDVDSAIDYLIFSLLTSNWDGISHNFNLSTYDGVKWYFNAYDLDNTFGMMDLVNYDANVAYDSPTVITPKIPFAETDSRVLYLPYAFDTAAFKARYAELRASIMSEYNVMTKFYNHLANVSKEVMSEEFRRWPKTIHTGALTVDQIVNFYRLRCQYLDSLVENL